MNNDTSGSWERDVLTKLATSALQEQRRARRWGIFFKMIGVIYFGFFIYTLIDAGSGVQTMRHVQHTALVNLEGIIAAGEPASAENVISGLRAAFENENSVAVILRVNTPGGSPVQAGYINDEINRLRTKYPEKPLYAVISDVCASGGIYAASAADEIYANKASIVGSIGVRMDNFGFVGLMDKMGIERRLLTAGEHKAMLDPFLPEEQFDVTYLQGMLDEIHQQFIDTVKEGRGDRLKNDPMLYSGLFWTGVQAVDLGLVDGLASAGEVARDIIGQDNVVDYTFQQDFWARLSDRVGASIVHHLNTTMGGIQLR